MRNGLAAMLLAGGISLPATAAENDFPTQARVEFVLSCMQEAGGQSYDTLYACVCEIDHIASVLSHAEYTQAETLSFLYDTPGERGGIFRDAITDARKRIKDLEAARDSARAACIVKRLKAPG